MTNVGFTGLSLHFQVLFRVYNFYSFCEDGTSAMEPGEYLKFCQHAKIFEKGVIGRPRCQMIFSDSQYGPITADNWSEHLRMDPNEWIEALIRIAHAKFAKHAIPIAGALEKLITQHISKHCMLTDLDEFYNTIRCRKVQQGPWPAPRSSQTLHICVSDHFPFP